MQKILLSINNKIKWITIGLLVTAIPVLVLAELQRVDRIVMRHLRSEDKYKQYYRLFEAWTRIHQQDRDLDPFFQELKIKTIAVYGNGEFSKRFAEDMKKSKVKICYYIDRNADQIIDDVPVLSLEEKLPEVDAVIVTIIDEFESISKRLKEVCDYSIYSLEDVIYGN